VKSKEAVASKFGQLLLTDVDNAVFAKGAGCCHGTEHGVQLANLVDAVASFVTHVSHPVVKALPVIVRSISIEQNCEPLAVSEAVSSASPPCLVASAASLVSSPDLIPSASACQSCIREQQTNCSLAPKVHSSFLNAPNLPQEF
jgi:hypothetical protein